MARGLPTYPAANGTNALARSPGAITHAASSYALAGDRDQRATFAKPAHGVVEHAHIYIRKPT